MRDPLKCALFAASLAVAVGLPAHGHAAPITAGDIVAIDFASAGGSAAGFNVINSNTTISAGNVIRYNGGTVVDGVSLTFAGATGFNNDTNANGWSGQVADPYYVENANDLAYSSGANSPLTLTVSGLDDALGYTVRVYSLFATNGTRSESFLLTDGAGTVGATSTRGSRWAASTLEAGGSVWANLQTDGSGSLVVSIAGASYDNPFVNAIVLEATVPEPSTLAMCGALCVMALLGAAIRRRRRRQAG